MNLLDSSSRQSRLKTNPSNNVLTAFVSKLNRLMQSERRIKKCLSCSTVRLALSGKSNVLPYIPIFMTAKKRWQNVSPKSKHFAYLLFVVLFALIHSQLCRISRRRFMRLKLSLFVSRSNLLYVIIQNLLNLIMVAYFR